MATLGAMGKDVTNPILFLGVYGLTKNIGCKNVYEISESRPYPTFCPALRVPTVMEIQGKSRKVREKVLVMESHGK